VQESPGKGVFEHRQKPVVKEGKRGRGRKESQEVRREEKQRKGKGVLHKFRNTSKKATRQTVYLDPDRENGIIR